MWCRWRLLTSPGCLKLHLQPGPSAVRKVSQPAAPKIRSPHRHRRVLSQEGMVGWEGPGASGGHVESVSLFPIWFGSLRAVESSRLPQAPSSDPRLRPQTWGSPGRQTRSRAWLLEREEGNDPPFRGWPGLRAFGPGVVPALHSCLQSVVWRAPGLLGPDPGLHFPPPGEAPLGRPLQSQRVAWRSFLGKCWPALASI